jgi:hypothetical protein
MLARLEAIVTLGLLAAAATWTLILWRAGHPVLAAIGALVILWFHALVLAAEFLLLPRANRGDPAPRAMGRQLLLAWWGEAVATPRVFCWHQPFRSQRWADWPAQQVPGRRGMLLVHGFVCNRGLWNSWLPRLRAQGIAHVAVNLEPVFGSIDDYVAPIEAAVATLESATGLAPVIVAHSMGGIAVRRWWAEQTDPARAHHVITIGSPHAGTLFARLALSRNARQMRRGSRWLLALAARESPESRRRLTCFYSHCDNVVVPASTATLPGADNRHLPGVAHVDMVDRPEPFEEALRRVQQA